MTITTLQVSAWRRLAEDRRFLGALLFAVGLAIYLPAIDWGLPHATAPDRIRPWGTDELAPLGAVAEPTSVVTRSPQFNPQYPLFHYLVQAVFVGPYVLFLLLTGDIAGISTTYPYGMSDPVKTLAAMTLLARLASALMAAGIGVVAWRTGSILWDERAGSFAGVLALLSYPMVFYSRVSNVDVGAAFWTALGLAVFAAVLQDGHFTVRRALWLGTFAALATATKDASYSVFVALGAVIAIRHFRSIESGADLGERLRAPLAGLAVALAVYAVASGFVLRPDRFFAHVDFILARGGEVVLVHPDSYYSGPATLAGYAALTWRTIRFLALALGIPAFLCALGGIALVARRRPALLLLLLPALATFLGVIAPVRFVRFRFVILIAYVLVFFAAIALSVATSYHRMSIRRAGWAIAVLAIGWLAVLGLDLTYQMRTDARYGATEWFAENARDGDVVGYYGAPNKLPYFDSGISTVSMPGQLVDQMDAASEGTRPEFLVIIPVQQYESEHEWTVRPEQYRALVDGSAGYRHVALLETPPPLGRRLISFVNPPVRVFAREDVAMARGFVPLSATDAP